MTDRIGPPKGAVDLADAAGGGEAPTHSCRVAARTRQRPRSSSNDKARPVSAAKMRSSSYVGVSASRLQGEGEAALCHLD